METIEAGRDSSLIYWQTEVESTGRQEWGQEADISTDRVIEEWDIGEQVGGDGEKVWGHLMDR